MWYISIVTVALSCSGSQQGQDYWKVLRNSNKEGLGQACVTWETTKSLSSLYIEIFGFGIILSKRLNYHLVFIVSVLSKGKRFAMLTSSSLMGKILLITSVLLLLPQRTVCFIVKQLFSS